jgi:hypothetical protein
VTKWQKETVPSTSSGTIRQAQAPLKPVAEPVEATDEATRKIRKKYNQQL